jgi:hypothetical protein
MIITRIGHPMKGASLLFPKYMGLSKLFYTRSDRHVLNHSKKEYREPKKKPVHQDARIQLSSDPASNPNLVCVLYQY